MRLTDDRINFLSHHIVKTLVREGLAAFSDEAHTSQEIKKLMIKFLKAEEVIDQKVRTKVASIKRNIPEGSNEWDALFEQFYREEMTKIK